MTFTCKTSFALIHVHAERNISAMAEKCNSCVLETNPKAQNNCCLVLWCVPTKAEEERGIAACLQIQSRFDQILHNRSPALLYNSVSVMYYDSPWEVQKCWSADLLDLNELIGFSRFKFFFICVCV